MQMDWRPIRRLKRSARWRSAALLVMALLAAGCGPAPQELVDRARVALEQQDFRAAEIDLKQALESAPQDVTARILLGRALMGRGDSPGAEREFRQAIELGANWNQVGTLLGEALLRQRRFDDVIAMFDAHPVVGRDEQLARQRVLGQVYIGQARGKDALQVYEALLAAVLKDPEVELGLALSREQTGDPGTANAYRDLVERHPGYPNGLLSRGLWHLRNGRIDAARADYEAALAIGERAGAKTVKVAALSGLIDALLRSGDADGARARHDQLVALDPESIMTRFMSARFDILAADYDGAIETLQDLMKNAPDFTPFKVLYGVAQFSRQRYAQAEMFLESAIADQPDNVLARQLLARSRIAQRKATEALEALEPLGDQVERDPALLELVARASFQAGDVNRGLESLEKRMALADEFSSAGVALATAYLATGRLEQARATIEQLKANNPGLQADLLELQAMLREGDLGQTLALGARLRDAYPGEPAALRAYGGVALTARRYDIAEQVYRELVVIEPDDGSNWVNLGWVLYTKGKFGEAESAYSEALGRIPNDPRILTALGLAFAARGDVNGAINWFRQAVENAGPNDSAPLIFLARSLLGTGDLVEAGKFVERIAQLAEQNAESSNVVGLYALQSGDLERAQRAFDKAVSISGDNTYKGNLALAQIRSGQAREAVETLGFLENERGGVLYLRALRVIAVAESGDIERALVLAQELRAEFSDHPTTAALLGDVLARMERYREASTAYDEAMTGYISERLALRSHFTRVVGDIEAPDVPLRKFLEKDADATPVEMTLASHEYTIGDLEEAALHLDRVVTREPQNVEALNNLAWVRYRQGEFTRALELARRAHELAPRDADVADTLGLALNGSGKAQEALQLYESALRGAADSPALQVGLARSLIALGRGSEVRVDLARIRDDADVDAEVRERARGLIGELQ